MATYGPRPSDTLDFAQVKRPEGPKEARWAIEEDRPRARSAFAPPSRLVLAMELALLVIVVASVAAYFLGWMR
ncbi:MAG TPA: hypothetical protein VEM77_01945 [Thermoplasmata archaeon]|nr:hypothetical protein [Thermoplasmata archaeon]